MDRNLYLVFPTCSDSCNANAADFSFNAVMASRTSELYCVRSPIFPDRCYTGPDKVKQLHVHADI